MPRDPGEFPGLFLGRNASDLANLDRFVVDFASHYFTEQTTFHHEEIIDSPSQDWFLSFWKGMFSYVNKSCGYFPLVGWKILESF